MFVVKSNFLCQFKVGDNINYNFGVLLVLYEQYDLLSNNEYKRKRLIKPIVVITVSIIEALLYDFFLRRRWR